MEGYHFKRIEESLYGDLCFLVKEAFGIKKNTVFFKHKMDTSYTGVKHIGYVAYSAGGVPAAFYGVYPQWMEYEGKRYLAAQSGDTMTHPAHSGKGLFTTLARMTYDLAKQEGIQFIFGFPNKNSYPGFVKKLNWTHHENIVDYTINIYALPLAAAVKKLPFLETVYNAYAALVLSFFKSSKRSFPNSVAEAGVGFVLRSEDYQNYKQFHCNHVINLGAATAWVKIDGALLVGDIEWKEGNNTGAISKQLKKLAFWLGCNKIIFPVSPGCKWDKELNGKFSSKEGIYIGYLDLQSGLPLEKFKYVLADFDTF
jgi:hypothetical protein